MHSCVLHVSISTYIPMYAICVCLHMNTSFYAICIHGASQYYLPVCSQCRLSETIGVGQFGNVCLGSWTHRGDTNNVAVKTLRKKAKLEDRMKFLREAAIMGQFMHPSIVKMHGVVLREDPVSTATCLLDTFICMYVYTVKPL